MKTIKILLTVLLITLTIPAHAADKISPVSGDALVSVNGLVCDFCARALEKVFGKEEAVKDIHVDLDTKILTIQFNENQTLDEDKLTKLITDSGYNVEEINYVE